MSEPVPLANHDEIGRKVIGQPWAIQSAIVTIAAHCTVIKDKSPAGDVSDLAGCISQDLLELANALSHGPVPAQTEPASAELSRPMQADIAQIIHQGWANGKTSVEVAAEIVREIDAPTPSSWQPTPAQVNSACLSYRHDFGLLSGSEREPVMFEAREWLRAWQKEGIGADRNEIIELCARIVDQANREGPYEAIASAKRIRALKNAEPASPHPSTDSGSAAC